MTYPATRRLSLEHSEISLASTRSQPPRVLQRFNKSLILLSGERLPRQSKAPADPFVAILLPNSEY